MTDNTSPELVAKSKRDTMLSIKDQEFQQWRHNPVTAGYLQYLEDQIEFYRSAAADILEAGQFLAHANHQDKNPDCLRGQILMLRQLHGLDLGSIHSFYGKEEEEAAA